MIGLADADPAPIPPEEHHVPDGVLYRDSQIQRLPDGMLYVLMKAVAPVTTSCAYRIGDLRCFPFVGSFHSLVFFLLFFVFPPISSASAALTPPPACLCLHASIAAVDVALMPIVC
eukprot:GHVU01142575.1.p1 GENE.GHVU01142575.1~~GHVU01142575.1.p1  ORF type:complete len:116 (+),score=9.88 GHVU01142575.1:372-719(+)